MRMIVVITDTDSSQSIAVTLDGSPVTLDSSGNHRTNNVTSDHAYRVVFTTRTFTVTVNWGSGGRVTHNGSTSPSSITVNAGDNLELFAVPQDSNGYEINTITAPSANINMGTGRIYFSDIQANKSVNVTFSLKSYTVRVELVTGNHYGSAEQEVVKASANGHDILPSSYITLTVTHGQQVNLHIELDNHLYFDNPDGDDIWIYGVLTGIERPTYESRNRTGISTRQYIDELSEQITGPTTLRIHVDIHEERR